jgi:hypothetical protein
MTVAKRTLALLITATGLLALSPTTSAADVEELTAMLHAFLANSDKAEAHQRFWADDLVYSSSAGSRFGKAEIMQGFADVEENAAAEDAPPAVIYAAENVDVRLYGDMAIVAFKLVGIPSGKGAEDDVLYYYNTGTFFKRDGIWQVVAWHATKIPPQ